MKEAIKTTLAGFREQMGLQLTAQPSESLVERVWQASPFARPVVLDSIEPLQQLIDEIHSEEPAPAAAPAASVCSHPKRLS